jgi:steroid delta-isomerase-like uncharacterized protein
MSEPMNQLIKDLLEGWNEHNTNKVVALYAPDYEEEDVAAAVRHHGPNAAKGSMLLYLRAFPDLNLIAEDVVVQDNCVAMSWILSGTHRGRLMNIPATGRSVKVRGVSIMTVRDGLIRRTCRVWDVAGLLRTFGLLPELF